MDFKYYIEYNSCRTAGPAKRKSHYQKMAESEFARCEYRVETNNSKVAAQPVEGASVQVIFACITLCSTIYAASCMRIYCTAPRAVATVSAVCILLVFFEAVFNSLQVTLVERLAVVLPTLVNIGLTWTIVLRHRKRCEIALPSSKLDV